MEMPEPAIPATRTLFLLPPTHQVGLEGVFCYTLGFNIDGVALHWLFSTALRIYYGKDLFTKETYHNNSFILLPRPY